MGADLTFRGLSRFDVLAVQPAYIKCFAKKLMFRDLLNASGFRHRFQHVDHPISHHFLD